MRTMRLRSWICATALPALAGLVACSPVGTSGNGVGGAGGSPTTTAATTGSASTGGGGQGGSSGTLGLGGHLTGSGGSAGGINNCVPGGPDDDVDNDGFTPNQGDCEDCDPDRNPNSIEVMTDAGGVAYDEDCDGQIDEDDSVLCDDNLAVDDLDPYSAARAIELCKTAGNDKEWGVVSTKWVLADGTEPPAFNLQNFHLGHGLLSGFGPNVQTRAGVRMLGLSSGTARQPTDPGYMDVGGFSKGITCNHPQGFPKESPACPGTITGTPNDAAGLELEIRPPSNAKGFSFDFKFQTFEWPGYVCSQYNDFFVALLSPIPANQADGNIAFDKMGNPVSVNNAFIEVCGCEGNPPSSCFAGGKEFECPLGDFELIGTGFGFDSCAYCQDHGGTGWLRTNAPVENKGQAITLRLAVYDSGDGVLDTTTIIDNWRWIASPGVTVGTDVIPE
jgi:hypothetical protein